MRQPSKTKAVSRATAQSSDLGSDPDSAVDGLRIIQFRAENVMKLIAVSLHPDGRTVVIGGDNGAGKTSVLTAIWLALGGKDAHRDGRSPEPLRRGAEKGSVELDLGELIVRRTFTANGGGSLTVRNREGAVYPSPQAISSAGRRRQR